MGDDWGVGWKGYDVELPVDESAVAHILVEHLLHLVGALSRYGHACRRQLRLTHTESTRTKMRCVCCRVLWIVKHTESENLAKMRNI